MTETTMTPAVPTSTEMAVPEMDREQATDITQRIRDSLERLQTVGQEVYDLLSEAQTRKAWRALGHATWDEYVRVEFKKERTWSFDMLTRGFVQRAIGQTLEDAGVDSDATLAEVGELRKAEALQEDLTLREATAVRGNLDEVTAEIRDRIQENPENAAEIVKDAVKKAAGTRRKRREATPLAETTVEVQGGEIVDAEIVDERSQDLQAAVEQLMDVLDELSKFPDPEDMAPHMDTIQWEKVNRARIWLLRFNMVMP